MDRERKLENIRNKKRKYNPIWRAFERELKNAGAAIDAK
jgi:hypothetical protein